MNKTQAKLTIDYLIYSYNQRHLTTIQQRIIDGIWDDKTYLVMAGEYSYTEGHIADTACLLFKNLSHATGRPINRSNIQAVIEFYQPVEGEQLIGLRDVLRDIVGRLERIEKLFQQNSP